MLRMLSTQPLIVVVRMVAAGRMLCWIALPMNVQSQLGTTPGSNPPEDGNGPPCPASNAIAISPSQKYGIEDRNVATGSSRSAHDPRRQPASVPSPVPSRNAATVVNPISASVHGRLSAMIEETGVGKNVNDSPRSPRTTRPRYSRYCWTNDFCLSSPKRMYSDRMALVSSCPP